MRIAFVQALASRQGWCRGSDPGQLPRQLTRPTAEVAAAAGDDQNPATQIAAVRSCSGGRHSQVRNRRPDLTRGVDDTVQSMGNNKLPPVRLTSQVKITVSPTMRATKTAGGSCA